MVAYMTAFVRPLLLAAVLALAGQTAVAAPHTTEPTATTRATEHAPAVPPADADGLPLDGLLLIAGVVTLVVFIAWLASRVGDNQSHVIS